MRNAKTNDHKTTVLELEGGREETGAYKKMISQDGGSNRWREGAHMKEGLIQKGGEDCRQRK